MQQSQDLRIGKGSQNRSGFIYVESESIKHKYKHTHTYTHTHTHTHTPLQSITSFTQTLV